LNPLGLLLSLTDSVARELAAVRERQARLQAKCDQDAERRQEALDALEMAQDRLVSAEARASVAECEARRLGRVVAEFQAGDMGLQSNFEAMRARMQVGGRTGGKPIVDIDERCLKAAAREKRIRRALERLPDHVVAILVHAFGPDTREIPVFGRATGVVPLTLAARRTWASSGTTRSLEEWLVRLVIRVHTGKGDDPVVDRALLQSIREEADRLLATALRAYVAERRHPELRSSASADHGEKDRAA
jgi:hypothetical protein